MLFWQYPGAGARRGYSGKGEDIYDTTNYDKRERAYAGAWVGKFLEIVNGFGAAHLEFYSPGSIGRKEVDAIVFGPETLDGVSNNSPSPVHRAYGPAYVYEIAPFLTTTGYVDGAQLAREWLEVQEKRAGLVASKLIDAPFRLEGVLPEDQWPVPQFSFDAAINTAGMPFNWRNADWHLGNTLYVTGLVPGQISGFPRLGIFSPFGMGFADLQTPTIYYMYLIADGLLVYVTENEVRNWGIASAAALSLAELMDKVYGKMEEEYNKKRGKYGLPPVAQPVPRLAYSSEPSSSEWDLCSGLNSSLCVGGAAAGIIGTSWLLWQLLSGVGIPMNPVVPPVEPYPNYGY